MSDQQSDNKVVSDGFGNQWLKCARADCGLEVVRPGKVQCECDQDCPECGGRITYHLQPEPERFGLISGWFCERCTEKAHGAAKAIDRELTRLRKKQAEAVMPLIGPLLDAWDGVPSDEKDPDSDLFQTMEAIARAMEGE